MKRSAGWRVGTEAVSRWEFEGVMESGGGTWLIGPAVAGVSLESALALPLPRAFPLIARLAAALVTLTRRGIPLFPLQTDAVLFSDDGDVLFLPPAIMAEIRDLSTFAATRDTYDCLNHPDLSGESRASFSVAVILYRLIAGRFPFTGKSAEDIHERARKLAVVPPGGFSPELAPEISSAVMEGLGPVAVSLEEWSRRLSAWQSTDVFRALSPVEKEKALQAADSRRAGSEKVFRRRMFWEKYWKTAACAAAGAVILSVVLGSLIGNALKPRLTQGYPPAKIVETFYESMNSLDHAAMQACVVGGAGQSELTQVTTLYVTSRVTQGYQGKSSILSASEWDRAGRPKPARSLALFGVTGLSVIQEEGEPTPVFKAAYDKWGPAASADTGDAASAEEMGFEGRRRVDQLWLRRDRGGWVIYRIEALLDDPLPLAGE